MNKKKLNRKKIIGNLAFLVILFAVTIYFIFKDQNLAEINEYIREANKGYLLLGLSMVFIFVCSESVIIHYLLHSIKYRVKLTSCIRYSFVGFFISAITPSASGGQPAQMYFMKKDGIELSISTLVLMVVTIAYKFVLVFLGIIMLFTKWSFVIDHIAGVWVILLIGFIINIVIVAGLMFVIFKQSFAKRTVAIILIKMGKRGWIKNYPKKVGRALRSIDKYDEGARYLRTHIHVMINVFLITVFQRIVLFLITFFVYKAFGLSGTSAYEIITLQTMIAIAVDNLPLPGGMGASEWMYGIFFRGIIGPVLLVPSLVLSRGLSFYSQIIFGAIVMLISYFIKPRPVINENLVNKQQDNK